MLLKRKIKELVHGSIYNIEKDGYVVYYHCKQEQIDHLEQVDKFLFDRVVSSASITIEFDTTATSFSFDYKLFNIGSLDTIDIYVNGKLYKCVSLESYVGPTKLSVELPEGNKRVVIYLPCDSETGIRDLCINGSFQKVDKRNETVLCYGDSITQGYGSYKTSITYINVLARELNVEVINQGIGGYWFDEDYIYPIGKTKPDKILISLGTNQLWSLDRYERIDKFFNNLRNVYPGVPVLVISPIWRDDKEDADELILDMKEYLINVCKKYSNVSVVDGYTLVPHDNEYYFDKLHPNEIGMKIYGNNLAKEIKNIKW